MRKFWLLLSILFIWTCGGGGGSSPTEPEVPPVVINLTSLGGQAQKGPFNNGTAINIAELTNTLSPTGRNFSSAITDNTGRFAVANVQLESPYVELRANGYYFNEVSNEISSGQLTLFALSNLTGKSSLNVNIITHLEKNRMTTLMSGDTPKTFAQAKLQAQEEVFAVFDYSRANVPESELLDISQGGAANGKLLAMSAILQGDLTVGQMSQLLANISTDIASDGTLDDASLRATLIDNSKNLDMAEVRSNLVTHYSSLGISATIPDFETEINQFLKPPVSQDMSASTAEDTAINITLAGSDPEGESLTYTILEVNNATVTLSGNVANYTPNAHFNGTDTFTYKANDGTSDSNIATVTMTVSSEDDEPNTIDVATTTDEDVAVTVNLSADEYDGDSYSFAIITDVSNGTTSLNGSVVTYTPNQDWNGTDTFTFEATDDRIMFGKRNVATATITVNAVNDAPVANDITNQITDENRMMQLDITLDATDVDGDALTYNITSTNNGSVTINGTIATYEPTQDWNGEDSFTYVANDGSVDSNTATVTITVNAVNDAPVIIPAANNGTTNMSEDGSMYEQFTATDVDGDDVTLSIVTNPANATITNFTNDDPDCPGNCASFTYTPTTNWHGTDTFTYKANDGTLDSAIETHTFIVNSVNDLPVVTDITTSTNEDSPVTFSVHDYITDSDGDDTYWSYFVDTQPANGTVTVEDSNNGNYTYTPNADWNGTDSFTWYVYDDGNGPEPGNSNVATTTITVNAVEDAPIANNVSASVDEDMTGSTIRIKGDATDNAGSDPDGDNVTFIIVSLPSNASIYNDAGGGIPDGDALAVGDEITSYYTIYNPTANYFGTDTFTFKTNDGKADSNIATVTVTVNNVDDQATAQDFTVTTDEDTPVTVQILSSYIDDVDDNDVGPNDIIVNDPSNGTQNHSPCDCSSTSFTYTPNANWNGTDTMTYKVSFQNSPPYQYSELATITVIVNPVDDAAVTSDISATTNQDTPVEVTFNVSDIDTPSSNFYYENASAPSNGGASNDTSTPTATYTPGQNWTGSDSWTYQVRNGGNTGLASNVSTVNITLDTENSLSFNSTMNGANGYLDLDFPTKVVSPAKDTPITYALWFKMDNGNFANKQYIIGSQDSGDKFNLYFENSALTWHIKNIDGDKKLAQSFRKRTKFTECSISNPKTTIRYTNDITLGWEKLLETQRTEA